MYTQTITPQIRSLVQHTSLALLSDGCAIKPSEIKTLIQSTLPVPMIQKLIDELYVQDVTIRRQITTEGTHITFLYTKIKSTKTIELAFGFISTLGDLSKYNKELYVAYATDFAPALFNTKDKYEARTQYKKLTGAKHNAVRMTKLATFK